MDRRQLGRNNSESLQEAVLRSVAEQLRQSIIRVARGAELGSIQASASPGLLASLQLNAETALRLVDSYILGLDYADNQAELPLESLSLSSNLYDINQALLPLAEAYGVELDLRLAGRYGPVMANSQALQASLFSLGTAMLEIYGDNNNQLELNSGHRVMSLVAHRTPRGIVAGWYHSDLRRPVAGRSSLTSALRSGVRQPFKQIPPSASAGIFVADSLFNLMQSGLRPSIYRGQHGIAGTLPLSNQLTLI